jgi:hypothetical protein
VLPSAIDDEPVVNIFQLLEYWKEEPPAHVTLALKYLGPHKKQQPVQNESTSDEFGQLSMTMGMPVQPVSQRTRDLVAYAEEQLARFRNAKGDKK